MCESDSACGGGDDVAPHVEAGDRVYFTGTRARRPGISVNAAFAAIPRARPFLRAINIRRSDRANSP